ncbi:ribonuclease VapC [Oceanithermus desulfurans NBRC 100063]|uniref:Ribonuclease VapC n=1 Tax=Oceanithermus desulfurans NBRC 100063 TaxID=1227550 RepID=A0A511RGH2_9DEIN|nr:ribonuclease VapC [Oceanithermus desulfurans NBRC 100063]
MVDTSVVVRYLTGDVPELAERAAVLLDGPDPLALHSIVLVETAFVLEKAYEISRAHVVDTLIEFLQKKNLHLLDLPKEEAILGLLLSRPSKRVAYADALLWALARSNEAQRLYTFDARFPADGIEVVEP